MENENTYWRTLNWLVEVVKIDPKHHIPDETVYQFSNGRETKNTDHTNSGVYNGT